MSDYGSADPDQAEPAPKAKSVRTPAQQEVFARAQAARAANVLARRVAQAEQHELARKIMEEKYGEKVSVVLGPRGRGHPSREEQFLLSEAKETLAMVRDQAQQAKVVEVPVMPAAPSVTTKVLQPAKAVPAAAPAAAAAPAPAAAPAVEEPTVSPAVEEPAVSDEQELEALAEMVMQRLQRAQVAKSIKKSSRRHRDSESESSEESSEEERDRSRRERRRDRPKNTPPPPPPPTTAVTTKPKRNIIFLS